jgi:hypothetical protein
MGEGDARLAAIETGSRTLRRARVARARLTTFLREVGTAVPADFCAVVTAWQAKRWKGLPPALSRSSTCSRLPRVSGSGG